MFKVNVENAGFEDIRRVKAEVEALRAKDMNQES